MSTTTGDENHHEPIIPTPSPAKEINPLQRIKTAGSVSIPPELFEQLYLSPHNRVKGELRQTFGNPTPIALGGFLICATPFSMVTLGWDGAGGLDAANVGSLVFMGGLLLILGAVGEWILGNTYPATVFAIFGGFWFSFGATLQPSFNAYGAYSPDPSNPAKGMNAEFFATFAFFMVAILIVLTVLGIASIRTNVSLFSLFVVFIPAVGCLTASFFAIARGDAVYATKLQHVGAGLLLAASLIGFYIFIALVLASVDFPIAIPLGDLSTVIKGANEKSRKRGRAEMV
ncbi:GPR1/FUN34/yaaH family-domain-containing protein [Penicillium cosmopolitanum]|uniref:GPR1/FUN34/yaaH family-domain-containing protein n=1 Tax=Penicillium cosmopolitanum TaxID=1131564 RepID=A0A9W9SJD0_9EURO|nr:GPR1/FUN34/yaaH family-domain-containing protein [Penicillium cosmopolitanum]KAJ5378364.1 GPR1/FUN34/yaaH family-domain-containing protein [Penicillium cosmopolitanum]